MNEEVISKLLLWFNENKRDLPWRHTRDAYKIWISEVMLQQTGVITVMDYYTRFIKEYPNIQSLSRAPLERVLKLWEGLGYYSRAKNLHKCAQEVIELGYDNLPQDKKVLQSLPGLGPYTVGAILSIAYNEKEPAIDGNVKRVLSRVYEEKEDISKPKVLKNYQEKLALLMPDNKTREFTEAFIELGALICTFHATTKCEECPLKSCCKAYLHNEVASYPPIKIKKEKKEVNKTVYVLEYENTFSIYKNEEGLLNGLYVFPNKEEWLDKEKLKETLPYEIDSIIEKGVVKHTFSHVIWNMQIYLVKLKEKKSDYLFVSESEIESTYSLPTAYKKVFTKLLK
mgnify:FL=1